MDVIIEQDSETAVIELARQHYTRECGVTALGRNGRPNRAPAEKFIERTEQALLEFHSSRTRDSSLCGRGLCEQADGW